MQVKFVFNILVSKGRQETVMMKLCDTGMLRGRGRERKKATCHISSNKFHAEKVTATVIATS